ncbi:aminotransferase-like domain-containing protein [[Mycobacterium] crassicus]|uniref:PLP-dependent aminotransferase family protein n=1 Tax=[Mycobacterium] crassicus TaxID=2872309 RepID=A0ABU5XJ72_9MYCO|nr:PLP-dependent aminotransferase family protein [Mycolicibacter sp. MYC098]MEB3022179.1 PLP-dependent aminotransferase family protein [Mycolicibacter sp. MYC098]
MVEAQRFLSDIARAAPVVPPAAPVPVTFNFDQGIPSAETFPIAELDHLHSDVLKRDGARALEYVSLDVDGPGDRIVYGNTGYSELILGSLHLRRELARWLGDRNARPDLGPDNLIITCGSVQAIALAINALVNPGDGVLVEAATFPYALRYAKMRGADIRPVAIDQDGLDPDALEARLREMADAGVVPKLLYIVATFQLPTCVSTSEPRRRRILELADKYDFLIIEDNIYGDLRYHGEPIPTLLSMDTAGRVLQSHGFSKTVAPALRIGWMTGPEDLISGMGSVRQDLGISLWMCRAMAQFVSSGGFDKQIERANDVYRRKLDVAVSAVREHCAPWVTFEVPEGGFYLWIKLSDQVDWQEVRRRSAQGGVAFRPGERFMIDTAADAGAGYLRLAYSHVDDDELRRGIAILGQALRDSAIK